MAFRAPTPNEFAGGLTVATTGEPAGCINHQEVVGTPEGLIHCMLPEFCPAYTGTGSGEIVQTPPVALTTTVALCGVLGPLPFEQVSV